MKKGGGTAIGRGHKIIGTAACLVCARELPAKLTPGGKLSLCCTWCDAGIYLNGGTEAFKIAHAKVKLTPAAADPEPAPAAAAASSAPAPASSSSTELERKEAPPPPRPSFTGPIFGMGGK